MKSRRLISYIIINALKEDETKSHLWEYYGRSGKEQVYAFAASNKILPFAAKAFVKLGKDVDYWNEILLHYKERNIKAIRFADDFYKAAENRGVTSMYVSENFAALLSADADISLFASGDFDNRAYIEDKEKIYNAAKSIGCTIKERYAGNDLLGASFYAPSSYGLPEKFYASIAFYPLTRLKLPCFIDANRFVEWDEAYTYKETRIRLLAPTALAYICMLHTSLHSFNRSPDHRLFVDLYFMDQLDLDYKLLASWAMKDQLRNRLAVAAKISNSLLNTQYSEEITDYPRSKKMYNYVYDENGRFLKPEPGPLKVLLIDIMCDDKSNIHGLWGILFPDKIWMRKVYGSCDFVAHVKHFRRLL